MEVPLTADSDYISRGFTGGWIRLCRDDTYSMFWNLDRLGAASIVLNSRDRENGWASVWQELHPEPSHEDCEEQQ